MLRLRDIMSTDLLVLDPELALEDAMAVFASRHVSGAPVVVRDKVVGVLSATDILDFAASTPPVPTEHPEPAELAEFEPDVSMEEGDEPAATFFTELWSDAGADVNERFSEPTTAESNRFAEHTVSEVMTRAVVSLPSATTVEEAAEVMRRSRIHRVLVMDDGSLVGIATMSDIAAAVADHKLSTRRLVFGAERKVYQRDWE
jgi:CBS domain-containing protein